MTNEQCVLVKEKDYNDLKNGVSRELSKVKEYYVDIINEKDEEIKKLKEELKKEKENIKINPLKLEVDLFTIFRYPRNTSYASSLSGGGSDYTRQPISKYITLKPIGFKLDDNIRSQISNILNCTVDALFKKLKGSMDELKYENIKSYAGFDLYADYSRVLELPWYKRTAYIRKRHAELEKLIKSCEIRQCRDLEFKF